MKSAIDIKFRKERPGPEFSLVSDFLKDCKSDFFGSKYDFTTLIEPYAEIGIPDILIVFFDRDLCENWNPKRSNLTKSDIKMLHHISKSGKKGVMTDQIGELLNFNNHEFKRSYKRLIEADLIVEGNYKTQMKDFDKNFFIKKIVSIEAKISDWKSAFQQAQLNENFASHSYVLLPVNKINDRVLSYCSGNTGLLLQDGAKSILKERARKNQIPGSYFSWILNEYLGRQYSNSMFCL